MVKNLFFSKIATIFLVTNMVSMSALAFGNGHIKKEKPLNLEDQSFSFIAKSLKKGKLQIKFSVKKDLDFTFTNDIYIDEGIPTPMGNIDNQADFCKLSLKKKHSNHHGRVHIEAIYNSYIKKIKLRDVSHTPVAKFEKKTAKWIKYTFSFNRDSFFKNLVCYKSQSKTKTHRIDAKNETVNFLNIVLKGRAQYFDINISTQDNILVDKKTISEDKDDSDSVKPKSSHVKDDLDLDLDLNSDPDPDPNSDSDSDSDSVKPKFSHVKDDSDSDSEHNPTPFILYPDLINAIPPFNPSAPDINNNDSVFPQLIGGYPIYM